MLPLEQLGPRIMVCGPSSSGKSTLARAMGDKTGLPVHYLDRFAFAPGSDWVPLPVSAFIFQHDAVVAEDRWIIEGNYFSRKVDNRLARATGIVLTSSARIPALLRYLRRSLFEHDRAGMLEGSRDSVKWEMVRWILIQQPKKRPRDEARIARANLPTLHIANMREMNAVYRAWGLER